MRVGGGGVAAAAVTKMNALPFFQGRAMALRNSCARPWRERSGKINTTNEELEQRVRVRIRVMNQPWLGLGLATLCTYHCIDFVVTKSLYP